MSNMTYLRQPLWLRLCWCLVLSFSSNLTHMPIKTVFYSDVFTVPEPKLSAVNTGMEPTEFTLLMSQLRNWNALSENDSARFRDSVKLLQQQIITYDRQLWELRQRIALLTDRKDQATKSLKIKSSLLSPIRKLPVELLEEIFSLLSATERTRSAIHVFPFPQPFSYMLTLARCCSTYLEIH
jgi:hypothetical protein